MSTYFHLDPFEFAYYLSIPHEYDKSNTGIRTDQEENM